MTRHATPEAVDMICDFADQMAEQVAAGALAMHAVFPADIGPVRLVMTEKGGVLHLPDGEPVFLDRWLREHSE